MTKKLALAACSMLALAATSTFASAQTVRSGSGAYGDWQADAPGVMRKITAAALPAQLASPSTANRSKVIPKPANAELKTMPGFTVAPFVTGMIGARVLRTAPNGDIFLALSRPEGKIMVIRTGPDMNNPKVETFAAGLRDAYGIAFYPPGPNPNWVYVGEFGKVVRFPYKNGDLTASGAPETVVSDLATGGNHWTRDVAFSPDGKTMYVAVGSASNVAEQMGPRPADFAAFEKSHSPGSAWDREEWRANVLTYTPDGKDKKVFASGVRNCSGLTVQPGTGVVYCATNERDLLGDNLPPDYVTSVKQGAFYGWPWYYIGDHEDTRPGGGRRPDLADKVTMPDVLVQPAFGAARHRVQPRRAIPRGLDGRCICGFTRLVEPRPADRLQDRSAAFQERQADRGISGSRRRVCGRQSRRVGPPRGCRLRQGRIAAVQRRRQRRRLPRGL